jgi:hypothetical protein
MTRLRTIRHLCSTTSAVLTAEVEWRAGDGARRMFRHANLLPLSGS